MWCSIRDRTIQNINLSGERISCKVCGHPAVFFGAVDFNKNPEGALPFAGVSIPYHRCESCGLIFSTAFDTWSNDDFRAHIYNDDYVKVDPEYVSARPLAWADAVAAFALKHGGNPRILDYGGGSGLMARALREKGLSAVSWDPMKPEVPPEPHTFDIVTCFEVLEHTPTPKKSAKEILAFLAPAGVVIFSTLVSDSWSPCDVNFWYVAPRNGHITIHTKNSLRTLFGAFGYRVHHMTDDVHMAFQTPPSWMMAPTAAKQSAP